MKKRTCTHRRRAPQVVVVVEGGVITDILCSRRIEAVVIDYDTDGVDDADLSDIPQVTTTAKGIMARFPAVCAPRRVRELLETTTNNLNARR